MTNTTAPTTTPSLPPLPTCILKQFVTETPSTTTTGIEGKHNDASALATARISRIEFSLLTSKDVSALSHVPIVNRSLYEMNKREPTKWGCLDKRLGTSDKKGHCDTCHRTIADCIGHFGHISLELPVFHIGYFKEVQKILQMICKHCSAILLKPMERTHYLKLLRRDAAEGRQNASRRREAILDQCKKLKQCDKCGSFNGQVKKITGIFRLIHDLKHKDAQEERENFLEEFRTATKYNKQLKEHLSKATVDLNPLICLYLFQRISDEDAELMGFNRHKGRPEDMIITQLTVPPVCIRPSVTMGSSGSNEDDLTIKLADIVHINNYIKSAFAKGALPAVIIENWEFLQQQVAMYVNSDLPGFPKTIANVKPIRALTQRLKGKTGRFRGNLSGKRVDFSGRTVISPDPNLRIDEVGVPERVAKNMTYPERVNAHNIEVLRQAVRNGCDIHPGANHVESTNGMKTFLKYGNRNKIAAELRYGDIVERHLRNGDFVLFNRQPSLHKMSIMCHRVRVLQWRTFRFNECVCTPYNADFDGDEMNLHVPQTEEARTEALTLMGVHENLVTPRHGEPLVTPTQDFLTTSFLITQKDVFYDQSQFCQICCYFNDAMENIELPMPAIVKPIRLWTGKQIFSVLLRPNSVEQKWPRVNIELKARNYSGNEMLCPQDGYVVFRNSELMCGNISKDALGGDKSGLTYSLIRDSSQYVAASIMNRIAKLSARWIGNRGFSIGINDVTPSESLLQMKNGLVKKGYEKCDTYIDKFEKGKLEAQPGCDEIQTLESLCLGELSAIREDAGSYCLKTLDSINNSPLIMAVCGSKGSKINISQMIACVGQQAVSGHRIPSGFVNRTLPHFPKFSRTPEAKGFVENSFYSGLTATEFFFHTMGGREGLVDTAVKTAETGYMQRRLMKALEDLCVQYDGSVRTSEKQIVQFLYGDDGLDPVMMAQDKKPVVFTRVMQHVRATVPAKDEPVMLPQDIIKNVDAIIATWPANQFRLNLKEYIDELAKQLTTTMQTLNLLPGGEKSSLAPVDALHILNLTQRITPSQLSRFLELCREKFSKAMMEPGTSVGAVGAQSIGEPGTQMTLKTFHFAGVASMNITLGVPRIKEIINAAKKISSPIITAPLEMDKDVKAARIVKARIEKTTLGEIAEYIEEVFSPGECYLLIKLDMHAIEMLQLSIDAESVVRSILSTKKMKLKQGVKAKGKDIVKVYPPDARKETMLYSMSTIKTALPSVIVRGIKDVSRAVINAGKEGTYHLLVEGNNLLGVMGTLGVKGIHTTSNHIIEVEKVLGIEAARVTIAKEINTTMESHGLSIDCRHVNLLADVMSYKGTIHGITRFGVAKMKESVLMLASFEKTADHLFEAALRGSSDHINGVSECIIMGTPIPVGTGLFQLLHQVPQKHDRTYPRFERSSLLLHKAESVPASTGRSR